MTDTLTAIGADQAKIADPMDLLVGAAEPWPHRVKEEPCAIGQS